MSEKKPRIAVISPFLDKQHGTERCVLEQLEALADAFEFHVYSEYVSDLNSKNIVLHHIVPLPGPHIVSYLWFFFANRILRWLDRVVWSANYDLIYSPGINCLDAELVGVHVVFAEFYERMRQALSLGGNPLQFWPRLLHRRLYYKLIIFLERRIYFRENLPLTVVSNKVSDDLHRFYGRTNEVFILYNGIDAVKFNPSVREALREKARTSMGYSPSDFVLLLIGNDWKMKGLSCMLEAVALLRPLALRVAVVGNDDRSRFVPVIERSDLTASVQFFAPRPEVEVFYAAADAYVGPSLEDAFGIPPLEAMACGLPVIVSRQAGVSELVTHGEDGYILEDPERPEELAPLIRKLREDDELRRRMGEKASKTARRYTWERNAARFREVLLSVLAEKQAKGLIHSNQAVPERFKTDDGAPPR